MTATDDYLDMGLVLLRIRSIWASQTLTERELYTSYRPPSPPDKAWSDKRLSNAVEALIAKGDIRRCQGLTGDFFELDTGHPTKLECI